MKERNACRIVFRSCGHRVRLEKPSTRPALLPEDVSPWLLPHTAFRSAPGASAAAPTRLARRCGHRWRLTTCSRLRGPRAARARAPALRLTVARVLEPVSASTCNGSPMPDAPLVAVILDAARPYDRQIIAGVAEFARPSRPPASRRWSETETTPREAPPHPSPQRTQGNSDRLHVPCPEVGCPTGVDQTVPGLFDVTDQTGRPFAKPRQNGIFLASCRRFLAVPYA
jgi:hypothetical protein